MPTHIKRVEVFDLYFALDKVRNLISNIRGSVFVSHLRGRLKPLIKGYEEMRESPEEFKEFAKERNKLLAEHAEKNPAGDPIQHPTFGPDGKVNGSRYEIDKAKSAEFQKKSEALNKKYKKEIDAENKRIEEINEYMLEDEEKFDLDSVAKIPLSWFKKEAVDQNGALDPLMPLIEIDDEEFAKMLAGTGPAPAAEKPAADDKAAPKPGGLKAKAK